jgi:hypothetical protein
VVPVAGDFERERDLRPGGLALERWFTDPQRRFAVTPARR